MDFRRVDNLPPYILAVIRELTLELRRAGADVVDLGLVTIRIYNKLRKNCARTC